MDALGAGGIDADRAQPFELLDQVRQGDPPWGTRRPAGPGQHAHRAPLLRRDQRIERGHLLHGQGAGELAGNVSLGLQHRGADEAFDHARAGCGIRRRRNSSSSVDATAEALVVARVTGSSQAAMSRRCAGVNIRKLNAKRSPSSYSRRAPQSLEVLSHDDQVDPPLPRLVLQGEAVGQHPPTPKRGQGDARPTLAATPVIASSGSNRAAVAR